jgi:DMSO/TMAO reductase YedYZ molybdopterin-dependent catalytic subunit
MDETERPGPKLEGPPAGEDVPATLPAEVPREAAAPPEDGSSPAEMSSAEPAPEPDSTSPPPAPSGARPTEPERQPEPPRRRPSILQRLQEPEETPIEAPVGKLRARSRRDFLLLSAGAVAAAGAFWWLLPDETRQEHLTPGLRDWLDSLEARLGADPERRERFLNRALTFDDDVAEALFSPDRSVRTYSRSQITPLRNNYNGATPKPDYLAGWTLALSGLASGRPERLGAADLLSGFARHDQVTRICCVEGWSAVAWWGGIRFADLLRAYPPAPGARWAKMTSAVNLDGNGRPDPYYVSIDLPTARHPQTLLATHLSGRPLPVAHGAPLRLVAPMKLGLKNIKAITSIEYVEREPADYWNERGYSRYDGL